MNIPEKLQFELQASRNSITQDGDLPARCREKILRLFEELSNVEHSNGGYLRRSRLALICAEVSMPNIAQYKDVSNSAKSIISKGILAIAGKYDLKLLENENENFHTQVIDLLEFGDTAFVAVYAGMACLPQRLPWYARKLRKSQIPFGLVFRARSSSP